MATLAGLGEERDRLLARVQSVLEADRRVTAAWLSGSFGRGEADEWSDLDLHVAVADESLDAFLAEHEELFSKCGQQILIFGGMPSNSMPGGRFWLAQYTHYMLEIDWNIGATTPAIRPVASQLIFDRIGIALSPPTEPMSDESRREVAYKQLAFFWAMAPIAIKFVGRGHTRLAVMQVDLLKDAFVKLWRVLCNPSRLQSEAFHQNRPLEADLDRQLPRFGRIIDPLAALEVIRALCAEVEALHPDLAKIGVSVDSEVIRQVTALAEIAELSAATGGSSPYQGSRR